MQSSRYCLRNIVHCKASLLSCGSLSSQINSCREVRMVRGTSIKKRHGDEKHTEKDSKIGSDLSEDASSLFASNSQQRTSLFKSDSKGAFSLNDLQSASVSSSDQNPEFPSDFETLNNKYRDQTRHSFRPKVNPRDTSLLLFPGQGSQFVGMGKKLLDYPKVEEMYSLASKILGYDLLDVCLNGPKHSLDKTTYCQPAVVVTSLAAVEKLKETNPWAIENCVSAAGYSVGEYAALVFAGALSFEDAVRLVKVRAEAMQKASEEVPGSMLTVFLRPEAKIRFACHAAKLYCSKELQMADPVCEVSNYLYPGCKVIAGNKEAVDFISQNAKEFGIKRAQYLPVSGAFHTPLMLPAKKQFVSVLSSTELLSPAIPVHSNVNSFKYRSPKIMLKLLSEQLYKPVKWEQTMHVLYSRPEGEAFPYTFEVGPGKQLGSILRMINAKAYDDYRNVEC